MRKTKIGKRLMAAVMAQFMVLSLAFTGPMTALGVHAQEKSDESTDKEEIVYVITDQSGNINNIIVSDKLKNESGSSEIMDMTDLENIENVKGDEEYSKNGSNGITWAADGNEITYQGNSKKSLPVDVKLSFKLDGVPISAENLAGKSGKVTIRFDYTNKEKRKVKVDGKNYEVYVPFTLMSGMILDSENFSNVKVTNGKAITEGGKTIVFGYAMPGLKDSLIGSSNLVDKEDIDIPDYVEMTADTNDFSLDMTMTAITNDLLDSVDSDKVEKGEAKDDVDELQDATDELVDGSGKLKDGVDTAYQGSKKLATNMSTLSKGANSLDVAIGKYTNGVDQLYAKVPTLTNGVSTLNTGASSLALGATSLKQGTNAYVAGVDTLADGLLGDGSDKNPGYLNGVQQLADGAKQLSGLSNLGQVSSAIALMAAATSSDQSYTDASGQSSATLGYGAASVVGGLEQIISKANKLNDLSGDDIKKLAATISKANDAMTSIEGKIAQADEKLTSAKTDISNASAEIDKQAGYVDSAKNTLKDKIDSFNSDIDARNEDIKGVNKQIGDAEDAANRSIKEAVSQLKDAKDALESSKDTLSDAKKALEEAGADEDKISKISGKIEAIEGKISSIDSQISALNSKKESVDIDKTVASLETEKAEIKLDDISSDNLTKYADSLDGNGIKDVTFTAEKAGISQIATGLNTAASTMGTDPLKDLIDGLEKVKAGAQSVSSGVSSLHNNLVTLEKSTESFPQAAAGITALNKGFDTLTANNNTLKTGATLLKKNGTTLKSGVNEIESGSKKLSQGTNSLASGSKKLSKGVDTLASNNKALNSGAKKLANGAEQLSQGSDTLENGMNTLLEGAETLQDGMNQYKEEGIQKIVDLYNDDILGLEDRFEAVREAGKEYQTYTKLAEGKKGSVKFIYKSDSIKKDDEE